MGETRTGSQAVERAMAVLESFAGRSRLTLTEVALTTGLPVSTAHRILGALHRRGFLERDGEDGYYLGARLRDLASAPRGLIEVVAPHLHALATGTKLTASYGIPDGPRIRVLHRARAGHDAAGDVHGWPLDRSALGLVLLAFPPAGPGQLGAVGPTGRSGRALTEELERIRRRGFALVEHPLGMKEVAVAAGRTGAVALTGCTLSEEMVRSVVPALTHFARLISHDAERRLASGG